MIKDGTDATLNDTIRLGAVRYSEVGRDIEERAKGSKDVGGKIGSIVTAEIIGETIATKYGKESIGGRDGCVVE